VTITHSNATAISTNSSTICERMTVNDDSTMRLTDVTLMASGCVAGEALTDFASTLSLDQVTATVEGESGTSGNALRFTSSDVTVDRATGTMTGTGVTGSGLFVNGGSVLVRNSWLMGFDQAVYRLAGVAKVFDSTLDGGSVNMSGSCTDVIDETLANYTCS
jgi:hypothetical protein